jgi:hypothetical protein
VCSGEVFILCVAAQQRVRERAHLELEPRAHVLRQCAT